MRNISIRIRSIFSGPDILLIFLLDIDLGELYEFLTFCVQLRVVIVTIFYPILLLICGILAFKKHFLNILSFHPSNFELASLEVEKQSLVRFSFLKVLHHITMVILRRLHFSLLLQLVHFKFKLIYFSLQVIIF
jgi:hypothetical protein